MWVLLNVINILGEFITEQFKQESRNLDLNIPHIDLQASFKQVLSKF